MMRELLLLLLLLCCGEIDDRKWKERKIYSSTLAHSLLLRPRRKQRKTNRSGRGATTTKKNKKSKRLRSSTLSSTSTPTSSSRPPLPSQSSSPRIGSLRLPSLPVPLLRSPFRLRRASRTPIAAAGCYCCSLALLIFFNVFDQSRDEEIEKKMSTSFYFFFRFSSPRNKTDFLFPFFSFIKKEDEKINTKREGEKAHKRRKQKEKKTKTDSAGETKGKKNSSHKK